MTCQTVLDNDLRVDFSEKIKYCIDCAFKRDIIKSTEYMCRKKIVLFDDYHEDKEKQDSETGR